MNATDYKTKLAGLARDALCDARRWHDRVELYEALARDDPHAAELYALSARGESLMRDQANRVRLAMEVAEFVGENVRGVAFDGPAGSRIATIISRRETSGPEPAANDAAPEVEVDPDALHHSPPAAAA